MAARSRQLNYSEIQSLMLDEQSRSAKAIKIRAVVEHFLGHPLRDEHLVDIGCSAGLVLAGVTAHGGLATGVDIDEPGLAEGRRRYPRLSFVRADSEQLAFPDATIDVLICNQVYEHVVSSDRLFGEIKRVLAPNGIAYLGLGNRHRLVEPHYRLPLLSWIPPSAADRYVRATRRGDRYHERFRTAAGLRALCDGLFVWDYTFSVIAEPHAFGAADTIPAPATHVPVAVWKALRPIVPTYLWVASPSPAGPQGPALAEPPSRIAVGPSRPPD